MTVTAKGLPLSVKTDTPCIAVSLRELSYLCKWRHGCYSRRRHTDKWHKKRNISEQKTLAAISANRHNAIFCHKFSQPLI